MVNVLILVFFLFQLLVQEAISNHRCSNITNVGRSLMLAITSRKNETGDWVTRFSAWKDSKSTSNDISFSVTHDAFEREGNQIVHIHGVVNELPFEHDNLRLVFHPNCGKNVAISNDGRTAKKINLDEPFNGVVLTNRPLKNNELFEVRLDKKHNKFKLSFAVGVTVNSPSGFKVPDHMFHLKSGNWMYYHDHSYKDGAVAIENYGRNLNELGVGDRVGVMRNNFGTLHYFVNGINQGPAASNVPDTVYGVFELYHNTAQGTIVDSSTP